MPDGLNFFFFEKYYCEAGTKPFWLESDPASTPKGKIQLKNNLKPFYFFFILIFLQVDTKQN